MSRSVTTGPVGGNGDSRPRQIRARLVQRAQHGGGTRLSIVVEERFYDPEMGLIDDRKVEAAEWACSDRYTEWADTNQRLTRDLESIITALMTGGAS